jgi:hypothetical protein
MCLYKNISYVVWISVHISDNLGETHIVMDYSLLTEMLLLFYIHNCIVFFIYKQSNVLFIQILQTNIFHIRFIAFSIRDFSAITKLSDIFHIYLQKNMGVYPVT